jgi:hypothetical protein
VSASVGPARERKLWSLTHLFRLHAVLAALYAGCLIAAPQSIVGLLTELPLNPVAIDVARLFGAALVLVAYIAWRASRLGDRDIRRMIASGLLAYTALGMVIAILGQLSHTWNALGWSTVITYLIFVFGYGHFLFRSKE